MPFYEATFIARQDLTTTQVEQLTAALAKIAGDQGAKVSKTEFWGLRKMAYKIKKNSKGHYVMLAMDAPAAAIAEMERNMRLSEDVLRFLTVKTDELKKEPSVMMINNEGDAGVRIMDGAPKINLDALKADAAAQAQAA